MQTVYYDLTNLKGMKKDVEEKVIAVAQVVQQGGIIAFPKETVYGVGTNCKNEESIRKVFDIKNRPMDNPLTLYISGPQWLPRYCNDIPTLAYVLTRKFWPGPLTLILKRNNNVSDIITSGMDTVAVRCPNNPVSLAIIREVGVPIVASSANLSGHPSCTSAETVADELQGNIDGLVDGGHCFYGIESTVIDLTESIPRLLRPGVIPLESLESLIGRIEIDDAVLGHFDLHATPKASGMKYKHYAPNAPITVYNGTPDSTANEIAKVAKEQSGILCFDEFKNCFNEGVVLSIGPYADQMMQARCLYDTLRKFNKLDVSEILVQCPDSRGVGFAVGNRLKVAAEFHVIETDVQSVTLGITGGTGSGKSTAAQVIEEMGGIIIDCDCICNETLQRDETIRNEINASFPGVFSLDGVLSTSRLEETVYSRKDGVDRFNAIIWKHMIPILEQRISSVNNDLCAVMSRRLLETGLDRMCDTTIAVTAPLELRVKRIVRRDSVPYNYARMRIKAQQIDEFYRSKCDYELINTGDGIPAFHDEAYVFFNKLIKDIKEEKRHGKRKNIAVISPADNDS